MISPLKTSVAVALFAASFAAATPAMATIVMVDASSIQGANVLFNNGTQTGTTVTGSTQSGTLVNFTGTTTASSTIAANGGQARVEGADNTSTNQPNDTYNLTSLNFSLASGTFNNLEFNLFNAVSGTANFTLVDNEGEVFTFNNQSLGNGSNFFGFQGINGESIRSISIATPGQIQDVRQIRLDQTTAVAAVPEPSTWAMMLVGFGAVGMGMRRRRSTGKIVQVA